MLNQQLNQFYQIRNSKLLVWILQQRLIRYILGIVGLNKIEPIFENVIKHPTGIMLRRGLLSTFSNISEEVQFLELAKNENTTLTFKDLIDGQKIFNLLLIY